MANKQGSEVVRTYVRTIKPILERVFLGKGGMPGRPTEWAKCNDVSTKSDVCHFSFLIALRSSRSDSHRQTHRQIGRQREQQTEGRYNEWKKRLHNS